MRSDAQESWRTTAMEDARGPRPAKPSLRLLWWTLPVVIAMVLGGGWLIGSHVWSYAAGRDYQAGDFASARGAYEGQERLRAITPRPWVIDYDLGTTLLAQGYPDAGVAYLQLAMDHVPRATEVSEGVIEEYSHECRVRMNLASGKEVQGDLLRKDQKESQARVLYQEGVELLTPCQPRPEDQQDQQSGDQGQSGGEGDDGQSGDQQQSGGGGGQGDQDQQDQQGQGGQSQSPGEQAQDQRGRLEDKAKGGDGTQQDQGGAQGQQEGQQGGGGDPSTEQTPEPFPNESDSDREKREQLEQKQKDAQRSQQDRGDQGSGGWGTGGW